jgi:hypothetical protein
MNAFQQAMMDREISPPPLKRRRMANTNVVKKQKEPHALQSLRLFSWNINGISPFIQQQQQPITSFFTSNSKPNPPQTQPQPQTRTPSLRAFLLRQNFPTLLLLQESTEDGYLQRLHAQRHFESLQRPDDVCRSWNSARAETRSPPIAAGRSPRVGARWVCGCCGGRCQYRLCACQWVS